MKKLICILLCLTIFICSGCRNKNDDNNTTTTTEFSTTEQTVETSSVFDESTESATDTESLTQNTTENQTDSHTVENDSTTTTKKNPNNSLLSDEDIDKLENSDAEVFFTDNPENKYIIAVSQKYGAKKENMVALIKVNGEFPTVTLFEFSGKKDKNGDLLMTYSELKFIYKIDQSNNTVLRVSKSGINNDGVTLAEAKVYLFMAKTYLIPELPNLKANKPYIE